MICLSLPILGTVLVRRASASCGRKRENISKTFLGFSGFLGRRQGKALSMADEEIAVKRQKACDGDVVEDGKGSESNGNGLPSSSTDPVEMAEDGKEESKPDGISAVIPGWFSEISPMWPESMDLASGYFLLWVVVAQHTVVHSDVYVEEKLTL
ncbi:hypothetical protein CKAN_01400800 [Cinnamomum micranthum f. kanehirae]|uniref:Uncharacterized protein n=1 Tax=Cinnamomum micranthum f. kanehirae TaxID=337451 RepID=A0A3S3MK22_9MAGN|nr:hypothetical protein CKAN_01400800 [Cinnamomum micranthum f. kanehirae]